MTRKYVIEKTVLRVDGYIETYQRWVPAPIPEENEALLAVGQQLLVESPDEQGPVLCEVTAIHPELVHLAKSAEQTVFGK